MKSRSLATVAVVLALGGIAALVAAQEGLFKQQQESHVTFVPGGTVVLKSGAPGKVEFKFRVGRGFHINSSKPSSELLIPTVLKLNEPPLTVRQIRYPEGKDMSFPFAPDEPLNVYDGEFTVTAELAPPAKAGDYKLEGTLRYQACSDRACFPPRDLAVEAAVQVR